MLSGPQSHQTTAVISTSWPAPEDPAHKAVLGLALPFGLAASLGVLVSQTSQAWEGGLGQRRFRELVSGASKAQSQPPRPPTHSQTLLKNVGLEGVPVIS